MITSPTTTAPRFDTSADDLTPTNYDPVVTPRTTSWGAIVAGAVTAMALMAIFAVLGTAIGLSVIGATNDTPEEGLGIGTAIYWLITGLLSLFVGGWVASRMRRTAEAGTGAMHGFLAWCTVTLVSSILLALAGGAAIGGSLAAVSNAMPPANQGVARSPSETIGAKHTRDSVNEAQAREAADNAAPAAWWTFIALVLGASVASLSGAAAAHKCNHERTHGHSARVTAVH